MLRPPIEVAVISGLSKAYHANGSYRMQSGSQATIHANRNLIGGFCVYSSHLRLPEKPYCEGRLTRLRLNDYRAKIVDVGTSGPRNDQVVERGKEVVAVVVRLVRECIHR